MKKIENPSNISLFFFTSSFPFGKTETFIENEIGYLSKAFEKVYIFPAKGKGQKRKVPENCEVIEGLFSDKGYNRNRILKKYPLQVIEMFLTELKHQGRNINSKSNLFSQCLRMAHKASLVDEWLTENGQDSGFFYTYWMSDWTTILSVLKSSGSINKFITRVHGFDLFEERQEKGFIPWRKYQLRHIDMVFPVSKMGTNYLIEKYPVFKSKIKTAYLGTADQGVNNQVAMRMLHLVSISNIIPLKRLHLIIEILKNVKHKILWTHFGDGELMDEIFEQSKALPANIITDFRGRMPNSEVLELFKTTHVSFFINVSDVEGLPVSIMEAISFGIPCIATNVGGTSEIINEVTGILIDKNFETTEVSEYLNNFYGSKFSSPLYREGVRNFWLNNFNAKNNYNSFIKGNLQMKGGKIKLLIISHTFPPTNGIGGRRWAKFANYLYRWGHDIYVFTSDNQSETISPWTKDVEKLTKEKRVINVNNSYPSILNQYPNSFIKKIHYRLALLYVRLKIKGNYYDRSTLWKDDLLIQVEKKVKEGFNTIVATGAPFRYIHDLLNLKNKYPYLRLIADFRDPWTNNRIAYGFDTLSKNRLSEELRFEKEILQHFDAIVSVYDSHTEFLKTIHPSGNYFVIPNGFDPEDCKIENIKVVRPGNKIKFVYAGTLYLHSEYIFKEFIETLLILKGSNPTLFSKLEFNFFGNKYDSFNVYFNHPELENTLFHRGIISLDKVYQEIQNADIGMLFLTDQMNYTKNTKFYEYIYMRKKIAVFSSPGFLEKYVVDNDLGYSLTPGNINKGFKDIDLDYRNKNLNVSADYDVDQYSISTILETYINNIISD